ncbi:hypothetical protein TM48_01453 [Mycobacterium shottsii]|nr:hypothetical protein TM48_01453 [Mycobacterium shottsii]
MEQAARIGTEIKDLRGKKTGQWLADRTAELGMKMTRQTITDLENGRRRYVTTAELAVLAAALNVAPIRLIYPGPDYNAPIEVLPGVQERQIEAVQWFSGIRDHGFTDSADGSQSAGLRNEYRENIRELRLWRELFDVYKKISSVVIPRNASADARKAIEARLDAYNDQVHLLRGQLGLEGVDDGG